jgi:hypothetical protein
MLWLLTDPRIRSAHAQLPEPLLLAHKIAGSAEQRSPQRIVGRLSSHPFAHRLSCYLCPFFTPDTVLVFL